MENFTNRWGWKQPIPTKLKDVFKNDYFSKFIFIELMLRARNSAEEYIKEGSRRDLIMLQRGQCVCGETEIGTMFGKSRQWGASRLHDLEKRYNLISILKTTKGTVITIQNYDDLVDISSQKDDLKASYMQPKSTNKHGELGKHVSFKQSLPGYQPFREEVLND